MNKHIASSKQRGPRCYICGDLATRILARWANEPKITQRRPVCGRHPDTGADSTLGYSFEPLPIPPASVKKQDSHFTIEYALWCGGTSIAYFDDKFRADMLKEAFNHWRKTEEAKKWFKNRLGDKS